ncbi:MAG: FecR family protein [Candidatus Acidiferrales bacterium]
MNARRTLNSAFALGISILLAMPLDVAAAQGQTQQAAGKITAMLPVVNLVRGPQQVPASTNLPVFWGDTVNTGHLARARVSLTDGSILSVGSDSNLTIVKHDAAGQQTDLELNYGKVRAQAVKLVKPDAHFKVRTPVGVAGVVGTVMIVSFDSLGNMNVICEEGTCQACDLAGNCVTLHGGQESNVHGNQSPTAPSPTTPVNMTAALNSTSVSGAAGAAGAGISAGTAAAVGIGAAAAAVVATVVVRAVNKTSTCSTNTSTPTSGAYPAASCKGITNNRAPGQKP